PLVFVNRRATRFRRPGSWKRMLSCAPRSRARRAIAPLRFRGYNPRMKRSVLLVLGGIGLATWAVSRLVRSDFSFAGRSVLITGGSRGLGLAIARKIVAEGGRVALLARDEAELQRASAELRALGGEAFPVPC